MSIRRLIVFLSVVFFAVVAFGATPTLISGVVLEAENDLPIKDVTITYVSGKSVGETNSDGRFEYTVSSSNASL